MKGGAFGGAIASGVVPSFNVRQCQGRNYMYESMKKIEPLSKNKKMRFHFTPFLKKKSEMKGNN